MLREVIASFAVGRWLLAALAALVSVALYLRGRDRRTRAEQRAEWEDADEARARRIRDRARRARDSLRDPDDPRGYRD